MQGFSQTMLGFAAVISGAVWASAAGAQDIPDLVGTWKGETQAVHIGPNPYRVPEHNGPNFADNFIEFTYVVKEQVGPALLARPSARSPRHLSAC